MYVGVVDYFTGLHSLFVYCSVVDSPHVLAVVSIETRPTHLRSHDNQPVNHILNFFDKSLYFFTVFKDIRACTDKVALVWKCMLY